MRARVNDVNRSLRSDHLTKRRSGAKELKALLEDGDVCAQIDVMCTDRQKTPMWCLILKNFLYFAEAEVQYALDKKRPARGEVPHLMRLLLRRAGESFHMLHQVVGNALTHLLRTLELRPPLSELQEGYCESCVALLSVPEYADMLDAAALGDALAVITGAMECDDTNGDSTRAAHFARIWEALLCHFTNDMYPCIVAIVRSLAAWCRRVDEADFSGREPMVSMFGGVNAVLRGSQGDGAGVLLAEGEKSFEFCIRHFRDFTRPQKEVALEHLRLQMAVLHAERPGVISETHAGRRKSVWTALPNLCELIFSESVFNAISPAANTRRGVEVSRIVDAGAARQILLLAADLIVYDLCAGDAPAEEQADRARKRPRTKESYWDGMLRSLIEAIDPQEDVEGAGQQRSGIAAQAQSINPSAYGWSLILVTTVHCRGRDVLSAGAGIEGIVRLFASVARLLATSPKDMLLMLMCLVSQAILRTIACAQDCGVPISPRDVVSIEAAALSMLQTFALEGSSLRAGLRDGDAGTFPDAAFRLLTSLLRCRFVSGRTAHVLEASFWRCSFWYTLPHRSAVPSVALMVACYLSDSEVSDAEDAILGSLKARPGKRRERILMFLSKLPLQFLGRSDASDEESGAVKSPNVKLPDRQKVQAFHDSVISVYRLSLLMQIQLLGGPPAASWLRRDSDFERLEFFDLVGSVPNENAPPLEYFQLLDSPSRETEAKKESSSTRASLDTNALALVWRALDTRCGDWSSLERGEIASWRLLASVASYQHAIADLLLEDMLRDNRECIAFACTVFQKGAQVCKENLPSLNGSASDADGSGESCTEMLALSIEAISRGIDTLLRVADREKHAVASTVDMWASVAAAWIRDMQDEDAAGAAMPLESKNSSSMELDDDFEDVLVSSGQKPRDLLDSQTSGVSLRLMTATTKLGVVCDPKMTSLFGTFHMRQDDFAAETRAIRSLLGLLSEFRRVPVDAAKPVLRLMEDSVSYKQAVSMVLEHVYLALEGMMLFWEEDCEDGEEHLPRILSVIYPTDGDGFISDCLRKQRAARVAQIGAASAALRFYESSRTAKRFIQLLKQYFVDPSSAVRIRASHATKTLLSEANESSALSIYEAMRRSIPPLEIDVEKRKLAFGRIAEQNQLPSDYVALQRQAYEETALHTLVSMAAADSTLLGEVVCVLCKMHVCVDLRIATKAAISRLARLRGYKHAREMAEDSFESIVSKWLSESRRLGDLPIDLLGYTDEAGFCASMVDRILPVLLLSSSDSSHRFKALERMADLLNLGANDSGISRLLHRYCVEIFAAGVVVRAHGHVGQAGLLEDLIGRLVPSPSSLYSILQQNLQGLVHKLIDGHARMDVVHAHGGTCPDGENPGSFQAMLREFLGAGFVRSLVSNTAQLLHKVSAPDLMLHIVQRMQETKLEQRRYVLFAALSELVRGCAEVLLASTHLLAILSHAFQWCAQRETLRGAPHLHVLAAELLAFTLSSVDENRAWLQMTRDFLLTSSLSYSEIQGGKRNATEKTRLLKGVSVVLHKLSSDASPEEHLLRIGLYVKELSDACPALGELVSEAGVALANGGRGRIQETADLIQDINDLVRGDRLRGSASVITSLLPIVKKRIEQLPLFDQASEVGAAYSSSGSLAKAHSGSESELHRVEPGQIDTLRPLLLSMFHLMQGKSDVPRSLVVRFLGQIGVCSVSTCLNLQDDPGTTMKAVRTSLPKKFRKHTIISRAETLGKIAYLLFDDDAEIVAAARVALNRIVSFALTPEVLQAIDDASLKDLVISYGAGANNLACVPAFVLPSDGSEVDFHLLASGCGLVASPRERVLARTDFEGWIAEATCSLIRECGWDAREGNYDNFWLACIPVCQLSPEICRTVYPAVLYDALSRECFAGPVTGAYRSFLEGFVFRGTPASEVLPEVMRVCIDAMHYCMDKQVFQFKRCNTPYLDASESQTLSSTASLGRGLGVENSLDWPYNHWLKDCLLSFAAIATELGAHCSALLFVELWCDYFWGTPGVVLSDTHAGNVARERANVEVAQVWKIESLLHRIYAGLGDADSAEYFEFRLQAKAASSLPAQFLYAGAGTGTDFEPGASAAFDVAQDGRRALQSLSVFDASMVTLGFQQAEQASLHREASFEAGIASSLRDLGLWNAVDGVVGKREAAPSPFMRELQAEAAWRSGKTRFLDRVPTARSDGSGLLGGYHFHLYGALRGMQTDNVTSVSAHLNAAAGICSASIGRAMQDDLVPNLLRVVAACQGVVEVEEVLQSAQSPAASAATLGMRWRRRFRSLDVGVVPFELASFLNDLRGTLLRTRGRSEGQEDPTGMPARLIQGVFASRASRKFHCPHQAQAALESVRELVPSFNRKATVWEALGTDASFLFFAWHCEQAHIDWSRGMHDRAVGQLRVLDRIVGLEETAPRQLQRSMTLILIGKWLAENKSESSSKVMNDYLQRGRDLAFTATEYSEEGESPGSSLGEEARTAIGLDADPYGAAAGAVARYTASLYDNLATRVQSSEWIDRQRIREGRKEELARCRAMMSSSRDREERMVYSRHIRMLESELRIDEEETVQVLSSLDSYLLEVMRSYRIVLSRSTERDLHAVSRVISLWFSSSRCMLRATREVEEIVNAVASHKFVPLSYQIFSRLDGDSSASHEKQEFQETLGHLVLKMCNEHPHHCLLQLIALRNGGQTTSMKYGESQFRKNVNMGKVQRAEELLHRVRHDHALDLLRLTKKVAAGYLALSEVNTGKLKGREILLKNVITRTGENLSNVTRDLRSADEPSVPAVFTANTELRADADYSTCVVRIGRFEDRFQVADQGISAPKIIFCVGRDGKRYKQLVKGQDDTRQDAVMQQTFATVNEVLREDAAARAKHLRIVTYRIVPLSPQTGVLEWVQNTDPFGSFLIDKPSRKHRGAHSRYYPADWSHSECRKHMKEAYEAGSDLSVLVHEFQTVCENIHPAFRFFLLERFAAIPEHLITRRRSYTKSVACSSIVGHVLGIGDRHTMNILVQQDTAEVVHIDFGITFEQGRNLLQPETVPFRLTRDIVDGMGVTQTSGAFTKACIDTLRVLRKSQSLLITILEVLLHDPLFKWMLSPVQARKRQGSVEDGASDFGNVPSPAGGERDGDNGDESAQSLTTSQADAAKRAILKVKQKLAGFEDDEGGALSVEGQVKKLITEAQDPRNLCRIFHGWAAWL
mmetsp:Transcript_9361/g.35034  ORF Transcript_9361/g.35034 Transcript_9361/m.35034 type:complete len:3189 (-) Transcript_9361:83-9649(-)